MNGTVAPTKAASTPSKRVRLHLPWTAVFGLVVLGFILIGALFASFLAPYDPTAQVLADRLKPPLTFTQTGAPHWLGTDALGRDLWSRILYGARVSLFVGVVSTAGQMVIGTLLGLLAGFYRGSWDTVIMRIVDIWLTIPFLALAIAVAAVLGPSLTNVILVLIITSWVFFTRVVRAEVLTVRERLFVEAARSLGARDRAILLRHILPNVTNTILVLASFQVARTILSEATLSFLGLGVQPPTPTWGNMVADGRSYLSSAWWISTIPGLAITFFVLSANLLGNWIRDVLDPLRRNQA